MNVYGGNELSTCKRGFVALIFAVLLSLVPPVAPAWAGGDLAPDRYFTVVDEDNRVIARTGEKVGINDQYVTRENKRYTVVRIKGTTAYARYIETIDLRALAGPVNISGAQGEAQENVSAGGKRPVAIYHTHSAESYVPTDGTDNIPNHGGIFDVGAAFARRLEELGASAVQSHVSHDPYDDAYNRSRWTAIQLLRKKRPVSIFDVHRDAGPPEEYATLIRGRSLASVMLVVGRINPNTSLNEQFAYQIKWVVDQRYPQLIKGILLVQADYNQDLAPRSLLLEAGSDTNSKLAAERGIALFAEAAFPVIYGAAAPGAPQRATRPERRAAGAAIVWAIVILIGAGLGFIALNSKDLSDFLRRLKKLITSIYLRTR